MHYGYALCNTLVIRTVVDRTYTVLVRRVVLPRGYRFRLPHVLIASPPKRSPLWFPALRAIRMVRRCVSILLVCSALVTATIGTLSYWNVFRLGTAGGDPGIVAQAREGRIGLWRFSLKEPSENPHREIIWKFAGFQVAWIPSAYWPADPQRDLDVKSIVVPFWFLTVLLLFYPIVVFVCGRLRRRRRIGQGRCIRCGYDLRASLCGKCSECGAAIEQAGSCSRLQ